MQIRPLQRPQDPVFPHEGRNASPGPSTGHLLPGETQEMTFKSNNIHEVMLQKLSK